MTSQARDDDAAFMHRSFRLLALWLGVIVVAGLVLLLFGDTLMELFV